MKKLMILALCLPLMGAACTTTKTAVVYEQAPAITIIQPAKPRPIRGQKINITVYDKDKLEVAMADPNFRRIIGMSEADYKAMAKNYEEAIRYIEAQAAIIDYYEQVITELKNRNIINNEPA